MRMTARLAFAGLVLTPGAGCTSLFTDVRFRPKIQLFEPVSSPQPTASKSDDKRLDKGLDGAAVVRPQAPSTPGESRPTPEVVPVVHTANYQPVVPVNHRFGGTMPPATPIMPIGPITVSDGSSWAGVIPSDPHTRTAPTVSGGLLGLGPTDTSLEKAVELAKKVEECAAENRALQIRIANLEQSANSREEAVAESVREVESATAEVARTRVDLKAIRRDLSALKDRLTKMEQEEAETLKTVIAALEKVLDAENK